MFEKKAENQSGETWKAVVRGFLDSLAKNFAGNFLANMRERFEEAMLNCKRSMFMGALMIVAIVFFLVGIAMILDQVVGYYRGSGYLIIAVVMMLIVLIIKAIKK